MPPNHENGSTAGIETGATPEIDARTEVLQAFNYARNEFRNEVYRKASGQRTEQEISDLNALEGAFRTDSHHIGANFESGKFSYTNKITNPNGGPDIVQKEGVPIEGLIDFLENKKKSLPPGEERDRVQKNLDLLIANSKTYEQAHKGQKIDIKPGQTDNPKMFARKRQEALYASQDQRKTGSQEGDYDKALNTLRRRRELVVPSPPVTPDNPPVTPDNPPVTPDNPPVTPDNPPVERKRISIDITGVDDLADKDTSLQAKKNIHERMSRGRLWEFWRWPEKIGLRLSQGGIENIEQEKLRRVCVTNNLSLCELSSITGGNLTQDVLAAKSAEQNKAILERFKAENITRRENEKAPIIEERIKLDEGILKTAILTDIIKPIVDGQITGTPREQQAKIREKLAEFVKNHMDDPQVRQLFGAEASDYGYRAELFATDLLENGLKLKDQMTQHNESLDQISAYIDIHLGLARGQYNTDIRTATDRAVAWVRRKQNDRLVTQGVQEAGRIPGWILNPAVVGLATSIATAGLLRSVGFGGRAATVLVPFSGTMTGAVIAGARRYIEIGGDKKMQDAELARGETIPERQHARGRLGRLFERTAGSYRREDLVKFRYDSLTVKDLTQGTADQEIPNPRDLNKPPRTRKLKSIDELLAEPLDTDEKKKAVAERMEEIRTRVNRGRRNRVDLITFTDKTQIDQELNTLFIAAERMEEALRNSGADVPTLKQEADEYWNDAFDRDKWHKDDDLRVYKLRQAAGAAMFVGVLGLGGAGTIELAKQAPDIVQHLVTELEKRKLLRRINGSSSIPDAIKQASVNGEALSIGNTRIVVEGNNAGLISLDQNGQVETAVAGNVTPDSHLLFRSDNPNALAKIQTELEQSGVKTKIETVPGTTTTENITEHFEKKGLIEKANRGEWLNHGTPGIYEGNELGLDFSIKPDGSVDLDMSKMIQENTIPASVNQDIITNPDGSKTFRNFEFLITPNDAANEAREVIRITAGPDGHAQVPAGTDIAQFFTGKHTQLAKYIEVVHINAAGKSDILATSQGIGVESITTSTPTISTLEIIPPEATPPVKPTPTPGTQSFTPVVPFAFRHPLEATKQPIPSTAERRQPTEGPGIQVENAEEFPRVVQISAEDLSDENIADTLERTSLHPPTDEEMVTLENQTKLIATEHPELQEKLLSLKITAETNRKGADAFAKSLRGKELPIPSKNSYTEQEWFRSSDLTDLANRWEMPLLVFIKNGNHFVLGLKEPELHEGKWRVLVYDPFKKGEDWHQLDNAWDINNAWRDPSIVMNPSARQELEAGNYNLSLSGDQEIANNQELYQAKQTNTQFNGYDCGPLVLFAAALRQGARQGANQFKSTGRQRLLEDTGINILTREEFLAPAQQTPTTGPTTRAPAGAIPTAEALRQATMGVPQGTYDGQAEGMAEEAQAEAAPAVAQPLPAAPPITPAPARPGLFSRMQNRVGGVFNRAANIADNTIDRSFEAVRNKTNETAKEAARRGARAVSKENLIEIGKNMKASSDELDATMATNNERFMLEIIPAAVRYVESTRELIDEGIIKIRPKLIDKILKLENKLKSLAAQSLTTAGKQSTALAVEVKRTVNSIQQIIGEQLEQRKQAAEARAATRATPIVPTEEEVMPKQSAPEFTDGQKEVLELNRKKYSGLLQRNGIITPDNLGEFDAIFDLVINRWPEINIDPSNNLNKLVDSISDKIVGVTNKEQFAKLLANLFSQSDVQRQYPQLNNYFNNIFSKAEEATTNRQYFEFMYALVAALDATYSQPL